MSEKARKTVVTLANVQEAFSIYRAVKADMGAPIIGHSFDRGNRGKGFAEYDNNDNTIRTFETKEEAQVFYGRYAEIAREVMTAVGHAVPVTEAQEERNAQEEPQEPEEGTEPQEEPQEVKEEAPVPQQTRRRVKASA